jgi:hypothetical protein
MDVLDRRGARQKCILLKASKVPGGAEQNRQYQGDDNCKLHRIGFRRRLRRLKHVHSFFGTRPPGFLHSEESMPNSTDVDIFPEGDLPAGTAFPDLEFRSYAARILVNFAQSLTSSWQ